MARAVGSTNLTSVEILSARWCGDHKNMIIKIIALHSTSSNRLATAAPSGIGTALPICLAMAVREPMKRWLSGKPWSRAAS